MRGVHDVTVIIALSAKKSEKKNIRNRIFIVSCYGYMLVLIDILF